MANYEMKEFVKVSLTVLDDIHLEELNCVHLALLSKALKLIDVDNPEYIDTVNLGTASIIMNRAVPEKGCEEAFGNVVASIIDATMALDNPEF